MSNILYLSHYHTQIPFSQIAMRREMSSDPLQLPSIHMPKWGLARLMETHSPPEGEPTAQLSKLMLVSLGCQW